MRLHHQRAHIHDGLKHLSDDNLIKKVREAPTRLKKQAKSFLKKLQKFGVKLDENGEVDVSEVKEDNIRVYVQKNMSLVQMTLMHADLEFEYPQKLEKMLIRADVIEMANKEEEKMEFAVYAKEAEKERRRVLTYEEYFQLDPLKDGHVIKRTRRNDQSKTDVPYEEWLSKNASENAFENDTVELEYKFWESQEERHLRIKKLWLDLKRKNALGGAQARTTEQQIEINKEIVELLRRVRWRVD